MEELSFSKIFYQFFANSENGTLTYIKVKQIRDELIRRQSSENNPAIIKRSFYLLIYLGLIDRFTLGNKKVFGLTAPYLVPGHDRTIAINCDFNAEDNFFPGLNYQIKSNESMIKRTEIFNATRILKEVPSIKKIIKYRFGDNQEDKPAFKFLERWVPSKREQPWESIINFEAQDSLYRLYPFNKQYYTYCFALNGSFNTISLGDAVTINLIKNFLSLSTEREMFKYDGGSCILKESFPLPEPIKKALYTNHILATGQIPKDRQYLIDVKILNQLRRIYS